MSNEEPRQEWLNYHHLHRFWIIARSGTMARAAEALHVSQSTLSMQLGELERWLGQPLFERSARRLQLNAAGRVTLEHAETIFRSGGELMDFFRQRNLSRMRIIRIGAVSNLSKNLQYDLLKTLLAMPDVKVLVETGSHGELLGRLGEHRLDLVLSNSPQPGDGEPQMLSHELGEMPVYLTGSLKQGRRRKPFPACVEGTALFLPTRQSQVRCDFDRILDAARLTPDIRAEVDDMALLRLLALSGRGLALVPAIVVEHELSHGLLKQVIRVPGLTKQFYAITPRRRVPNVWIEEVIQSFRAELRGIIATLKGRDRER